MSDNRGQSFSNHARLDPLFHFFLLPVVSVYLVVAARRLYLHPDFGSGFGVVCAFAIVVGVLKIRTYSLKVQDRLIRLEERLRMRDVLPAELQPRVAELSESQLVALRFGSDGELAGLVKRALDEKLSNKQIKQAIAVWRPDTFRV